MSKNWVNLHAHSTYSMLDGFSSVEQYVERVRSLHMNAMALTDHGNVHGWLDFYEECKKYDVKPILGIEAYQARKTRFDQDEEEKAGPGEEGTRGPYHLTILAKNHEGYKNVMKLTSNAYVNGYYNKPRVDYDLLSEHSEGIIVLSGCLGGAVQQALLRGDTDAALAHAARMQEIVGHDNYFIEMMDHGLEEQRRVNPILTQIADHIGAKMVVTGDCHYANQEDANNHDVMLAVGTGALVADEKRFKFHGPDFYLQSYEEMASNVPEEWLDNTLEIADMIDVEIEFGNYHFPKYPQEINTETVEQFFEQQVYRGLVDRYGQITPEIKERADYEIGVITRMGFPEYFLVVADIVNWAKDHKIKVGAGRGSGAASIVSYALKITNLDPLFFGLSFERFLVEGRKSMPDFDLDFDDRYREDVIQYVRDTYGDDHVCQIATFSTVRAKSAIRDAGRVLGHEYQVINHLASLVPPMVLGVTKTLEEALDTPDMRKAYENDPVAKEILDAAFGLEGLYRQPGVHAAGVVITDKPVTDYAPVMVVGRKKQVIATQWTMGWVERIGLLKIDFLGLINLSILDVCLDYIKQTTGEVIDLEELPLDDAETFKQLCQGNTMGVFQLESSGMKDMAMAIQPQSIQDLMAIVSLYRPGPMGSGMDRMYVNRRHGREKVTYPSPLLKDVLADNYGIMLYQEDVMNATRAITGWDAAGADDLRKVMGKKLMDKVSAYRKSFVEDAQKATNTSAQVANKIYSDIEFFAGYGFNKAHACSYGYLAYLTAYFKTHYPLEYMAALLTRTKKKDKLSLYLNECRQMGIEVLPPSIAKSNSEFQITDGKILFGLSAMDGIGPSIIDAITSTERDWYTLHEFLRGCDLDVLNKTTLEHLARSGTLDDLIVEEERITDRQQRLDILQQERSELGIWVTEHPLEGVWEHISPHITHSVSDLEELNSREMVKLGGLITQVTPRVTRAGKKMANLRFADMEMDVEVVVFPAYWKEVNEADIYDGAMGVLTGKVEREGDDEENSTVKIIFDSWERMDVSDLLGGTPIHLEMNRQPDTAQVERLCGIMNKVHGDSPVFLTFTENGKRITIRFKGATSYEIKDDLVKIVGLMELTV